MLFAAGLGARMGALTKDRPKPLLEVAGRPLIDHAMAQAEGVVLRRRVANVHYRPEALADYLEPQGVVISWERERLLDTGGGLRQAQTLLGPGAVFTINTDAVWSGPPALRALAAAWDPVRMDALLLTLPLPRTRAHGGKGSFFVDGAGRLSRGPGVAYTGAQIVKPDRLAEIPETVFSLNRLWDLMIAEGRLYGVPYPGLWCDVGRPEGIAAAEAMLREPVPDV